jgi:hypothetical protein
MYGCLHPRTWTWNDHDHDQGVHAACSTFLGAYILHMQENFLEAELLFLEPSRMYVVQTALNIYLSRELLSRLSMENGRILCGKGGLDAGTVFSGV